MSLVKTGKEAIRFMGGRVKIATPKAAIDLVSKQPVIKTKDRIVSCDGGRPALGHPKVFINLDHGVHTCGYCGQRFEQIHKH